jgi:hypothetical protein
MSAPQKSSCRTQAQSLWVLYDLRNPEGRQRARKDWEAWGKDYADVYPMGLDHVLLVFRPGGAQRLAPRTPSGLKRRT